MDLIGHLNASTYFTYYEATRIAYTQKILPSVKWNENGMIVIKNEMTYKVPIYLHDKVYVSIGMEDLGNTSATVGVIIFKKENDQDIICALGYCILVYVDFHINKAISMPAEWKRAIEQYEEKKW